MFIWGNAESCVTIVAASIPVLRVLIRDARASYAKYYVSEEGKSGQSSDKAGSGDEGSNLQSQNSNVVVSNDQPPEPERRRDPSP